MKNSFISRLFGKRPVPDLAQECAAPSTTGVRQSWIADSIANGLTPARLAAVMHAANTGDDYDLMTLAEEIEERSEYGGLLGVRKRAVLALSQMVEAASDLPEHKAHADGVRRLVKSPEFRRLRADLLDALGKGRSTLEILWDTNRPVAPHWLPRKYVHRDPRFFRYHPDDPEQLMMRDESSLHYGVPLRDYTFITHRPRIKTGSPVRDGLARMVVVYYLLQSFNLKDWMAYCELMGIPIRVGRYGPNAKSDDIAVLRRAVANISSDAAALIPESMRIEFIERSNGSGTDIFERLADWLIGRMTFVVLGQSATTQSTPGKLGGDDAKMRVADDIRDSDATELDATLNATLVRYFVDLNFGVQEEYPCIVSSVDEPEDVAALVSAIEKLVPLGLRVKQSQVRDKLKLEEPDDGDELLQITAMNPRANPGTPIIAPNRAHDCPQCHTALNRQKPDALDALAEDALSDWEPVMKPLLDPIQVLADECANEEEFLARLPELLQTMDASVLISQLATATFKGRGMGDANA